MNFEQAKGNLNFQKELQKESRENKVRISGWPSANTEAVLGNAEKIFEKIKTSPEGEENEKAIVLSAQELGIDERKLKNAYFDGLRYEIKASLKLGLLNHASGENDIERIIAGFTLNFRKTLKFYVNEKRAGKDVFEDLIIGVAKKGYVLSPKYIRDLMSKYEEHPDIGEGAINQNLIKSTNPGDRIEKKIEEIAELKKKYEGEAFVDNTMLKVAVNGHRYPELKLEEWLTKIKELMVHYQDNPDFDETMIKTAVIGNKKPDIWLENLDSKISQLKQQFPNNPDINSSTIKTLALKSNPIEAARILIKNLDKFSSKFADDSDADRAFIKKMILGYSDAENVIARKLGKIKQLRKKYGHNPNVENWMIKEVVTAHDNPEAVMIVKLKKFDELKLTYKDAVNESDIKYAVIMYSNPDEHLAKLAKN